MHAGGKAIFNLGQQHEAYASIRKVFDEVLSPKAVLEFQPDVEDVLGKRVLQWNNYAETGEARNMCTPSNGIIAAVIINALPCVQAVALSPTMVYLLSRGCDTSECTQYSSILTGIRPQHFGRTPLHVKLRSNG